MEGVNLRYIVSTFVNITIYPWYNCNMLIFKSLDLITLKRRRKSRDASKGMDARTVRCNQLQGEYCP
jgi:hypothetical protein